MEDLIVGACLTSRQAYQIVKDAKHKFTPLCEKVYQQIDLIYSRDQNLESCPKELVMTMLERGAQNPKTAKLYMDVATRAYGLDVSVANVVSLLKEDLTHRLAMELVGASQKRDVKQVSKLLAELEKLGKTTEADTLIDISQASSITDLVERRLSLSNLIKIAPLPLTDWLGGGCMGGHHIIGFARPEAGKSAFGITTAAGFIKQKLPGIYLMNEDRRDDIELRLMSCLTEIPSTELRRPENIERASEILERVDYRNRVLFADCNPGTITDIERMLDKHQPKWLVTDQLRNLDPGKSESNTNRLDTVARTLRDLLKKYNVLGVSLTQAGDSASNKKVLEMSDIDSSKTGIPAACDVLVGIGVDEELYLQNTRILSVCKNKMPEGKGHGHFPVSFHGNISKFKAM